MATKRVLRKRKESRRHRSVARKARFGTESTGSKAKIMSVITLGQNKYLPVPFTVPPSKKILIDMESEREVNLFVLLNEQELQAFQNSVRPAHRAAFNTKQFYGKIDLSALGDPVLPPSALSPTLGNVARGTSLPPFPLLSQFSPLVSSTWYLVIENRPGNQAIAIYYRVYNA